MSGGLWIASYVVLCVVVIALCGGVAALYRGVRAEVLPVSMWPFFALQPGEHIPLTTEAWRGPAFVLATTAEDDSYAVAVAVAAVADDWGISTIRILVRDGAGGAWVNRLTRRFSIEIVDPRDFDEFGAAEVPIVAYVEDGVILEAAAGLLSPTAIATHFRLVAGPLSQSTDKNRHAPLEEATA